MLWVPGAYFAGFMLFAFVNPRRLQVAAIWPIVVVIGVAATIIIVIDIGEEERGA
jgi:hypothetical protein